MTDIQLSPLRLAKRTQWRLDFGLPYAPVEAAPMQPLPYDDPGVFEGSPPLTAGYDSYEAWTKKKSLRLHHIIDVPMGFATRSGNVFDAEGRRVEMASHKSKANKKTFLYNRNAWKSVKPVGFKPTFCYSGDIFVATSSTAKFYYHYLLEIVPRLHIAKKFGLGAKTPVYVDASQPFMKECLRALKIDNIIDASVFPRIQAHRLIVPCYEIGSYDSIPKWTVELLNELFADRSSSIPTSERRLYLSRRNAPRRTISNETQVSNFFQNHGFETVYPETMSIQQQASLFRQASIVAGPSGGACTNVAFCKPGAKLLNLFHWKADNSFQKLCAASDVKYLYVASRPNFGERLQSRLQNLEIGDRNYTIEIDDLRNTFRKIE